MLEEPLRRLEEDAMRHTPRTRPGSGVILLRLLIPALVLVFMASATLSSGQFDGPVPMPEIDADVRKAELELEILRLLLREAGKEFRDAPQGAKLDLDGAAPVDSLRRLFPKPYDELLPRRDPWGNSYLVLHHRTLLVSAGPDGTLDLDYEAEQADAGGTTFLRDMVDDIVADEHTVISGPRRLPWKQAQTVSSIRSLGTAIEAFAVDANAYPGPTGGLVVVDWVAPDLSPTFIRKLPSTDGWGEPIYFWSDGVEYLLMSFGADGQPDRPYFSMSELPREMAGAGRTIEPERDIIYHVGGFVQWPESPQR
jgi:general secretion pathway protein G